MATAVMTALAAISTVAEGAIAVGLLTSVLVAALVQEVPVVIVSVAVVAVMLSIAVTRVQAEAAAAIAWARMVARPVVRATRAAVVAVAG